MGFNKYKICASAEEREKMNSFDVDCEAIKGYMCDIGNGLLDELKKKYLIYLLKKYRKVDEGNGTVPLKYGTIPPKNGTAP